MLAIIGILAGKDLKMGPLDRPVVVKSDGKIPYLDHLDTEDLRKIYASNADPGLVSLEKLVEVDLVADGGPLADILAFERVGLKGYIPAKVLRLEQRVSDEGVAPGIHCFLYTPRSFTDLLPF